MYVLRHGKASLPVAELIRKNGYRTDFYCWQKFVSMDVVEIRRLRQLEKENRKLKQLVADLSL